MSPDNRPPRVRSPRRGALAVPAFACVAAACAALAAVALAQGGGASAAQAPPAGAPGPGDGAVPTVRVASAVALAGERTLRLPLRTEPIEQAALFARTAGFVAERRVELGDAVAANAVLATISAPDVDAARAEAEAQVVQARADEALALANRQRAEAVISRGAISQETLTTRVAEHERAAAARRAAEQNAARWRQQQGFQQVRAPFAGTVVARNVERGDRVSADGPDATPLFVLARLDRLRGRLDVPPAAAAAVQVGQPVQVRFAELPGRAFTATVARRSGLIDAQAGTMRVEIELDNGDGAIPAGLVGRAELAIDAAGAVAVPLNAVTLRDGQPFVATLDAQDTLRFVPVAVGRNLGAQMELVGGVAEGARVVLAPNAMLQEGQRVQVAGP